MSENSSNPSETNSFKASAAEWKRLFSMRAPSAPLPPPPKFARGMASADLILCVTHGLLGLFFAIVLETELDDLRPDRSPYLVRVTSYVELITALAIGILGMLVNRALPRKESWGLPWEFVLMATTLVSLVAGYLHWKKNLEDYSRIPSSWRVDRGSRRISDRGPDKETRRDMIRSVYYAARPLRLAARVPALALYTVAIFQYARYFRRVRDQWSRKTLG